MKQPLWILNSSLLGIFICTWVITVFLQEAPPQRVSLQPRTQPTLPEKSAPKVSVARIYENDIFGTYTPEPKPQPVPDEPSIKAEPPKPPKPQDTPKPPQPEPSFIAPLEITLKGVIFTNNEEETRAIIADNKTDEEDLYQIGESIQDADIVHIGKDKVILMRSNGQQETIFITEKQAQEDPGHPEQKPSWSHIIKKTQDKQYTVDPDELIKAVPNLAYFIDALDLTTAFDKSEAVGCHVGGISADSLGDALGLEKGDIITHINGTSTATTDNRVNIYQNILQATQGDTFTVRIKRKDKTIEHTYTVAPLSQKKQGANKPKTPINNPIRDNTTTNRNIMNNASKQKKTVDSLQSTDKRAMLNHGGREEVLQRTQT